MLHRQLSDQLICMTQPTHAWVAGQLARHWGNEAFGQFAPWEEVCLGAEQHDIGWHRWEGAPTLNRETGYPHSFSQIPTAVSVDIWSRVKEVVVPLGRYPALLISLHGTGLFQRFTHWQRSAEATQQVEAYLQQESVFQAQLTQQLQADPHYAPYADAATIARNRQLVATWDTLSLMLCMGIWESGEVDRVPDATGETSLRVVAIDGDPTQIKISPWPFHADSVTLVVEGRILAERFTDETLMRQALAVAEWVTIVTSLIPG